MRFEINLATRTYLDQRLVSRVGSILILVLIAFGAWNAMRMTWNLGERKRLEAEIAVFDGRLDKRPAGVQEKEATRQQDRIRLYNEIIARKCYNWLVLLDRIEEVTPDGVALTLLTPDMKTGEVKLQANAGSFAQVRTYMERLEESKNFSNIMLQSHREVMSGATGRGVQFAITARVVSQ